MNAPKIEENVFLLPEEEKCVQPVPSLAAPPCPSCVAHVLDMMHGGIMIEFQGVGCCAGCILGCRVTIEEDTKIEGAANFTLVKEDHTM